MDAPVTGGDTGAKAGTLSILVGGEKEDYEACMPLFEAMGTNINYQGKAGCGQHCKLANQIMIAGTLSGSKQTEKDFPSMYSVWFLPITKNLSRKDTEISEHRH